MSELSRLGRSVGEIITLIDTLVTRQIRVFALKEGLRLTGPHDLQTTVIVTLCGLFAEIERALLSLRTKEALAAAKAAGKRLGRPLGTLGKSKLDGKQEEIKTMVALRVSKASIAKIMGVDRTTLYHFIRSRRLVERDQKHNHLQRIDVFCSITAGTPSGTSKLLEELALSLHLYPKL